MRYIVVINGPEEENKYRLKAAREVAKGRDTILAIRFDDESLDEILKDKKYISPKEKPIDTIDDALIAKNYVGRDDVVLVTSKYHMRRAKKIFEKVLNREIKAHPAEFGYNPKRGLSETIKYLWDNLILFYKPNRDKYLEVHKILLPIIGKIKKYLR